MPTYESHTTSSAVFAAPAFITYPFGELEDTATKIVSQPLMQLADQYAPPTIGGTFSTGLANLSGSPITIGDAYCIGDSEPQLVEAGIVSFTRSWANIPATRYDYETQAFTFPSLFITFEIRPSVSKTSTVQISHEYYRVGAGLTYTSPDLIPLVSETMVTYLSGARAFILSDTQLNNGGGVMDLSSPTYSTYNGWISAKTYNIVAECSIERWKGNIWCRKTRRVLAK